MRQAAAKLAATERAYTRTNLYHCWRRLAGPRATVSLDVWTQALLEPELARGPLEGLLPPARRWDGGVLPREWNAYFPRAIVVVDRPAILDLFIASGILTTARLAIVCIDGSPASVVQWLRRGFRAGQRAPVGYLHDAATAFYPFAVEPLASLIAASREAPVDYCDLGLPPSGVVAHEFPFDGGGARKGERITELEALAPRALIAHATRRLLAMVPGDPRMAPLAKLARTDTRHEGRKRRP